MSKESLKQIAYNTIKNKILTCDYKPNAFLNEDIICADLKMSRTPVRDALSRIEQENLIKIFPKKGFLVSSFSKEIISPRSISKNRYLNLLSIKTSPSSNVLYIELPTTCVTETTYIIKNKITTTTTINLIKSIINSLILNQAIKHLYLNNFSQQFLNFFPDPQIQGSFLLGKII